LPRVGREGTSSHHRRVRDLIKSVRSEEFEYEERPRKSLDQPSYDDAQAYELDDMLCLVDPEARRRSSQSPACRGAREERAREASCTPSSERGEGTPDQATHGRVELNVHEHARRLPDGLQDRCLFYKTIKRLYSDEEKGDRIVLYDDSS